MKSLDGLHPELMRPRVAAMLADPRSRRLGLYVVSAFRSIARQHELYEARVRRELARPDVDTRAEAEARARKWVALPGRSNHGPRVDGFGTAVDLGLPGVKAVDGQWPADLARQVDAIATDYGLRSPMEWEDWHYEPIPNWRGTLPATEEDDMTDAERAQLANAHHFATVVLPGQVGDVRTELAELRELIEARIPSNMPGELDEIRRNARAAAGTGADSGPA